MMRLLLLMWSLVTSRSFRLQSQPYRRHVWRLLATIEEPSTEAAVDIKTVLLKRSKQSKAFRNGSPLVFTRAIQSTENAQMGDLVEVKVDADPGTEGRPLSIGYGVFNPSSLYRVRILCHRFLQPQLYQSIVKEPDLALQRILEYHLQTAVAKRTMLGLPNASTNTYRLVNGEGDALSGLAVDVIGTIVVVMSSAAWCERYRPQITAALTQVLPDHELVWKTTASRLVQDGCAVELTEQDTNGIRYQTHPLVDGQKTGVYCDQRDNRRLVAEYAAGRRVLDLCCYHGGFALSAMAAGAMSATAVDSSADAIETVQANAALNIVDIETICSDVTDYMQSNHGQREFDFVVLDPPKLAPSATGLDKARRKYHGLNRDAIKLVAEQGGLLLTCTCSSAMTQKDGGRYFLDMVAGAALAAGRSVTLLKVTGAAPCHTQSPVAWPAGAYLTAALFYVHPSV